MPRAHPSRYFAQRAAANYLPTPTIASSSAPASISSAGVHAYALYDAQWDYEQDYDSGSIEAASKHRVDSSCGHRLDTGAARRPAARLPFYTGTPRGSGPEIADLPPTPIPARQGEAPLPRASDDARAVGRFSFDSLRIVVFDPAAQPGPVAVETGMAPRGLELTGRSRTPRAASRASSSICRAPVPCGWRSFNVGHSVRTLAAGSLAAGRYVGWDRRDDAGRVLAPGVYLARLRIRRRCRRAPRHRARVTADATAPA